MSEPSRKSLGKRVAWLFAGVPVVATLAILLVVNGFLLSTQPLASVDPASLPSARTWSWWAVNDFRQRRPVPDIVCLGSSIVMIPLWHQEAAFRNEDVDLVADHRSTYLESVIRSRAPLGEVCCFNFAMPGSMVSDAAMVVLSMLKQERTPRVVIIGLGPREFVDNKFNNAASSKHYQYLAKFADTKNLVDLSMPQIWQRPNYWIKDLVYFKGHSKDSQVLLDQYSRRWLTPFLSKVPASPLEKVTDEDRRFASFHDELEKGYWVAHPSSPYRYNDFHEDCERRLRRMNNPMFENQKSWLALLLTTCKQRDILPIIVNMPLTEMAMQTMPPGMYQRHVETLQAMASKYDCCYVDINNKPGRYVATDYTDWAHMNASGGKKVLDDIGAFIGSNKRVVDRLSDDQFIAARRQKSM